LEWPVLKCPQVAGFQPPGDNLGVIRREEAYLEAKFGNAYLDYKTKTRRWL
jgi:hypothetical protein